MSVLDAAGPQAARIAGLWSLMLWTSVAVFVLVVAALGWALVRARADHRRPWPAPLVHPGPERGAVAVVSAAVVATVVVLFVFLVASVSTGHGLASLGGADELTITVTGHQWWWEITYDDATPARRVVTANEIHVPVGRPVRVVTDARDVIHSFWVPSLHGKRDLIPGHTSTMVLRADRPGVFRGQCAEFCGLQHAHMLLLVVAEPPPAFEQWLAGQRQAAASPADERARHGQRVFMSGPCALCHTIRGTEAGARLGPDLTHLASRTTLGAGIMPNNPGHLAGWIVDPQHIKPGSNMPAIALASEDLQALLAYLGGLR
jgi:cytochrome c oxidase subunit II